MDELGQKCSALSRLYVSSSVWDGGFKDQFLAEIAKIKVGPHNDWDNFMGPVMYVFFFCLRLSSYGLSTYQLIIIRGRPSYDKIIGYIKKAKEAGDEILIGGSGMTFFFCKKNF